METVDTRVTVLAMPDCNIRNVDESLMRAMKVAAAREGWTLRDWCVRQWNLGVGRLGAAGSAKVKVGAGVEVRKPEKFKKTVKRAEQVQEAVQDGKPCGHGLLYHPGCTNLPK